MPAATAPVRMEPAPPQGPPPGWAAGWAAAMAGAAAACPPSPPEVAAAVVAAEDEAWGEWQAAEVPAEDAGKAGWRGGASSSSWEPPGGAWREPTSLTEGEQRWLRRSEVGWKKRGKRGGWQAAQAAEAATTSSTNSSWWREHDEMQKCPGILWGEGWMGGSQYFTSVGMACR